MSHPIADQMMAQSRDAVDALVKDMRNARDEGHSKEQCVIGAASATLHMPHLDLHTALLYFAEAAYRLAEQEG